MQIKTDLVKPKIICFKFMKTFTVIGKLAKNHAVEIIAGIVLYNKIYFIILYFYLKYTLFTAMN